MMSEIIKSNQKTINIKRLIPYTALACKDSTAFSRFKIWKITNYLLISN